MICLNVYLSRPVSPSFYFGRLLCLAPLLPHLPVKLVRVLDGVRVADVGQARPRVVDDPVHQALGPQDLGEVVVTHSKDTAADGAGDNLLPGVVVEMDTKECKEVKWKKKKRKDEKRAGSGVNRLLSCFDKL